MLPAVILAAGDSMRMGSPKALLTTSAGRPFVAAIVETFASAGIRDVAIVTGRDHVRIVEAIAAQDLSVEPRIVRNPDPSRGQLSSLIAGMDSVITPQTPALLVTLVDVPMLTPAIVRQVIEQWQRSGAPIVRPALGEQHGHPVLFARSVFDELRSAPLDVGAKAVVRAHAHEIVNVPVTDAGCLTDVDTPADYARLLQ